LFRLSTGAAGDYRSMGDNRIPPAVIHEDWEVPATPGDYASVLCLHTR